MALFKSIDDSDDENIFPFDESDSDEDEENEEDEEKEESENEGEIEEIESKLEKGEDVAATSLDYSALPKSRIVYVCPRCKKIYWNQKWVKDNITDIFTVRTELSYCPKCIAKPVDTFVGSVEVYDLELNARKKQFIELAKEAERDLEDHLPFEKIINTIEKNGILFIFVNSTRLALEIGKRMRQEFHGGVQYEWFERNQYLRVKWYHKLDNRDKFKKQIRELKEYRFGLFSFEDQV